MCGIDILFASVSILYAIDDAKAALAVYIILMVLLFILVVKTDILFAHEKKGKE